MPISMAVPCTPVTVKKVAGSSRTRNHLQEMGITEGERIMVISKISRMVLLKVRGVSLAVGNDLARKIFV